VSYLEAAKSHLEDENRALRVEMEGMRENSEVGKLAKHQSAELAVEC